MAGRVEAEIRRGRGEVMVRILIVLLALGVAACGKKAPVVVAPPPPRVEIVEVDRPVPYRVPLPPELLAPLKLVLPEFISPFDPRATSAMDPEGERRYRQILEVLRGIKAAIEAYGTSKD